MRFLIVYLLLVLLSACNASPTPLPEASPQVISKFLATVAVSPTPNAEQLQATRFASTPTPSRVPPTPIPSPSPYIGVFIGEAQPEGDFPRITQPLFAGLGTPIPTSNPLFCPIAIDVIYLSSWLDNPAVSSRMGCPIQEAFGFFGQAQVFERGVMYRRDDSGEVWALLPNSAAVGQYYYVEKPPPLSTEGNSAPRGLFVPTGDFGSVWSAVQGLRDEMGFALTEQQRVALGIQRFEGGSYFLDGTSGQIFALIVDGSAYGPYTAPQPAGPPTPLPEQ